MKCKLLLGIAIFVLALLSAPLAHAIDIAMPSDFPAYEFVDNDPGNMGYYFSSAMTMTPSKTVQRPYAFMFDTRGNPVWYYTDSTEEWYDINVHYTNGKYAMCHRNPEKTKYEYYILDSGYTVIDTVFNENPYVPTCTAKWHGVWFEDDGTTYYLWDDKREVDMSGIGGFPDCLVSHNAIQQWDADGNLLWEWYSIDHIDQLIYECRPDQDELLEDSFTHLHINSFQVLPSGDILCHARVANTVFLIDRATGNIAWGIGGYGIPGEVANFTMFTNLTLPPDVGVGFIRGHDATLLDNGTTLTFYDNGRDHEDPLVARAYGRIYELDFDNETAELTWYYYHPDEFNARVTGSTRLVEDDKVLIGWGGGTTSLSTSWNGRPTVSGTEVDQAGNTIWEMKLYQSPYPYGVTPKTWRWHKFETFTPANEPYLSHVYDPVAETIELYANWFGHEAEITSYDVYAGLTENDLYLVGNTDDGIYFFEDVIAVQAYYFQVEPLDVDGNSVGPMSNLLYVSGRTTGFELTPLVATVPAGGGNIYYAVDVVNGSSSYMGNLLFRTYAETPNSVMVGPLVTAPFTLLPFQHIQVSSLSQEVPSYAPAGDYTFSAEVTQGGNPIFSDSFSFTKEGANTAGFAFDPNDWSTGGDLSAFSETVAEVASATLPLEYTMQAAYPNPFNPTTMVNVALPDAAELTVAVYNVTGQLVATLSDGQIEAGTHSFVFDASNLASGLYFVRALVPGELNAVQKVMLVR